MSSRIAVGKVIKAFGLEGQLVILPMTHSITRFKRLKRVFVGTSDDDVQETTVTGVKIDQRGVRLRLALAPDRTHAERFLGKLLFVDPTDAISLPKGTYFIHDLIGMVVTDEAGTPIGILKDVLKYPAQDVYVVDSSGEEILIPAVKQFIKHIDAGRRTIRVALIEGMRGTS